MALSKTPMTMVQHQPFIAVGVWLAVTLAVTLVHASAMAQSGMTNGWQCRVQFNRVFYGKITN